MDEAELRETIDSFIKGDYVYVKTSRFSGDTHRFVQYSEHKDYSELISQKVGRGPVQGHFWLDLPTFFGKQTPIPIPGDQRLTLEPEKVAFITNDMKEAAEHLRSIGQEAYARYVENMIIPYQK